MSTIALLIPRERWPELLTDAAYTELDRLGSVVLPERDDDAARIAACRDADIAIGTWHVLPDAELAAACPRLKLWIHAAGTVKAHFHRLGGHVDRIGVVSCAAAIAPSVAEFTLARLIDGLREIPRRAAATTAGERPARLATTRAHGCKRRLAHATIGVVAASMVGRAVIGMLRPLAGKVLCYDPYLTDADAEQLGVERVSDLAELCARSEAITVHAPALPATDGLIDEACFLAMQPGTVFVNTSRPSVVDERALEQAISTGHIDAFLDVVSQEFPRDPALRESDHLQITPHDAGGPDVRIGDMAVRAVRQFLAGEEPEGLIAAPMLERLA